MGNRITKYTNGKEEEFLRRGEGHDVSIFISIVNKKSFNQLDAEFSKDLFCSSVTG